MQLIYDVWDIIRYKLWNLTRWLWKQEIKQKYTWVENTFAMKYLIKILDIEYLNFLKKYLCLPIRFYCFLGGRKRVRPDSSLAHYSIGISQCKTGQPTTKATGTWGFALTGTVQGQESGRLWTHAENFHGIRISRK